MGSIYIFNSRIHHFFFYSDNCYLSISTRQHLGQLFQKTIWCLTACICICVCVNVSISPQRNVWTCMLGKCATPGLHLPFLRPWFWDEVSTSLSGFHLTHSGSGGCWPCYLADPACEELCPIPSVIVYASVSHLMETVQ